MARMLDIEGLTKRFGRILAVDDISFSVDRGEVLGVLGPNGAGKTTAMRMVTGFLPPTAGRAVVCGFDTNENPIEVRKRIGYLPEGAPLYEDMTPAQSLSFVAEIRELSGARKRDAIDKAAHEIHIDGVMNQTIGTLSKGFKRRVGIAQAILHDPEVLILDEPTDGLDPNQKHEVRDLINRMAENKAIIISTHLLEEVEVVCTRAIIMANGRIVADGTPASLEARSGYHNAVSIRLKSEHVDATKSALEQIEGVKQIEMQGAHDGVAHLMIMPVDGRVILDSVSSRIRDIGVVIDEIRVERGRLDEVFRQITTSEQGPGS